MRHSFKIALGLVATSTMAALALPAGLAGAAAPASISAVGVVRAATVSNSDIVLSGKKAAYSPTSLSANWTSASPVTCTAANVAFSITNTTTKTQKVVQGKKVFAKVPKGEVLGVCLYGSGSQSVTLKLKKSKSTLTVSIS
jgi:anti-sigma factor RsiW